MDISNLERVLAGKPKYLLQEARRAVFQKFILNWNQATFLQKELREKLNKECPLSIEADVLVARRRRGSPAHEVGEAAKESDSAKAKITLKDSLQIETTLMRHKDPLRSEASGRNTVCVSCQVGCALGCQFCATGTMGYKRNLTSQEIIEQVLFFERYLKAGGHRVSGVTFMGMGEPFLNYDNVLGAVKLLNDKNYFNIGQRSISISTAGITEGIEKLANEGLQVNLAISLHAPNDKLRSSLMPINKKYSLKKVLEAVDGYIAKTKRKVMFEYVLIKDINDSDSCAKELAMLMKKKLYFVNLILYNATGVFKPSDTKRVTAFKQILKKSGINFGQRYRFGQDIKAACGQLVAGKQS